MAADRSTTTTGAVSARREAEATDRAIREESGIAPAVQDITAKAQLLVREEIELARVEVTEKLVSLAKGAGIGVAAGVVIGAALLFFLHGLAWGLSSWLSVDPWVGYFIVAALLLILGAIAGAVAMRLVNRGKPPRPELAIDEAQRIRQTIDEARH